MSKKDDDNNDLNNGVANTLKLSVLITGYVKDSINPDETSTANKIISFSEIIIRQYGLYLLIMKNKFQDILISDQPNFKESGDHSDRVLLKKTEEKDIIFNDIHSKWYFDRNQCPNCFELNCLSFSTYYDCWKAKRHWNRYVQTFGNKCNEYQCEHCKYYIGLNNKTIFIQTNDVNSTSIYLIPITMNKLNEYILQAKNDNKLKFKDKLNELGGDDKYSDNKVIKCNECKNDMKFIYYTTKTWSGSRYAGVNAIRRDYCDKCQIVNVKNSMREWSVSL